MIEICFQRFDAASSRITSHGADKLYRKSDLNQKKNMSIMVVGNGQVEIQVLGMLEIVHLS